MKLYKLIWCSLFLFLPFCSVGQNEARLSALRQSLDSLSYSLPQLEEPVRVSLEKVSLADYIRALGRAHQINVFIEDTPMLWLSSDFKQESLLNVFLFVCKQFEYSFEVTGTILSFFPYEAPEPPGPEPEVLDIQFQDGLLSVDLQNDSLQKVLRTLSALTGKKLLTRPGTHALLNAFLPPTELDTAFDAIFTANNLKISMRPKGYILVEPQISLLPSAQSKALQGRTDFSVEVLTDEAEIYLSISAEKADLEALLQSIFLETGIDFLLYDKIQGVISLETQMSPLEELLHHLLQGTDYTYRKEGTLFLIGSKKLQGLQSTQIVHLQYRPTSQAIELIPGTESLQSAVSEADIMPSNPGSPYLSSGNNRDPNTRGQNNLFAPLPYSSNSVAPAPAIVKTQLGEVKIVEYPELNRIILQGPGDEVAEIAALLHQIDQPVPMVKVEMMVIEVNQNRLISTSVKAGIQEREDSLSLLKSLIPNLGLQTEGAEINKLLRQIPALSNLGMLSNDFYLQILAQEARGNLTVEMQPVLSMLNGRMASLVIGQTQYYLLETQTAANGAVNNYTQFSQRFERIDANIRLSIRPFITEDETVILEVMPDFTTPVGALDSEVPPTIATRRFDSTIRVQNGETVILGGLTEERKTENTEGLPLLSRIPVLKWFFGSVNKGKTKNSLLIYLTPTIYYQ